MDIVDRLRQMRNDTACYPEVCDDAMGEILYLRLQLAQAMKERSRAIAVGDDLEQEAERLRLNASRYRWHRENPGWETEMFRGGLTPDQFDAATDAAMKS